MWIYFLPSKEQKIDPHQSTAVEFGDKRQVLSVIEQG